MRLAALAAAVVVTLMPCAAPASSAAPAKEPAAKEPARNDPAPRTPDTKAPASKKPSLRGVARPTEAKRPTPPKRQKPESETEGTAPPASSFKIQTVVHEVSQGETLSAIAKQYGVPVSSIVITNKLRGSRAKLSVGQRLTIQQRPGAVATVRPRRAVDEPLPVSLVLGVPDFEVLPEFRWPVEGTVSSTYGRRRGSWHRGLDIRADAGSPIIAAAAGVVIASGWETRYGQRVTIGHDGGFMTLYAHNQRNLVEVGQIVEAGQVIAMVGRTGRATGDHVHFEVRYDGRVYNPLYVLPLPPRTVKLDLSDDETHDDE
jgi:LysM repeat protein